MRVCDEPTYAGSPWAGPPANCPGPPDQTRYVYWVATGQGWAAVVPRKEFCAINPVDATAFVDKVLLGVGADPVTATVTPFTGALPVKLPVYLWVQTVPADKMDSKTTGTLTVATKVTNPRFVWYMDDGNQVIVLPPTSDPGGPYPNGKIHYAFQHPGVHHVHLQVLWDLIWTANDPVTGYTDGGTIQIEQAPRPQFDVNVVEAHGVLVS